ncbi:MAG: transposase [Proteobacteria bacterium]|nr:transposase [Pseudomonadota bacterium]
MRDQIDGLDTRIGECDQQITTQQATDPLAKRAWDLPGVGLITADAVTASVGDASMFRNGRQFAAWLGLTVVRTFTGFCINPLVSNGEPG